MKVELGLGGGSSLLILSIIMLIIIIIISGGVGKWILIFFIKNFGRGGGVYVGGVWVNLVVRIY